MFVECINVTFYSLTISSTTLIMLPESIPYFSNSFWGGPDLGTSLTASILIKNFDMAQAEDTASPTPPRNVAIVNIYWVKWSLDSNVFFCFFKLICW